MNTEETWREKTEWNELDLLKRQHHGSLYTKTVAEWNTGLIVTH